MIFVNRLFIVVLKDDLFVNTVLNKLNGTLIDKNLTIITEEGNFITVNLEDKETTLDRVTDSINIVLGTNSSPQFNIVTYQDKDNPSLVVSSTVPTVPHAVVARGLVGNNTIYGAVLGLEGSSDEFINKSPFVGSQ
ncbi:hypothetical protein LCGC14_2176190 [marine sediment metagenome]|uniref:Uncharacterized protein n=1 Tax=marine sediment metagenome TaxID=412755 RepID=A0A0F9DNL1_9ZZZZ